MKKDWWYFDPNFYGFSIVLNFSFEILRYLSISQLGYAYATKSICESAKFKTTQTHIEFIDWVHDEIHLQTLFSIWIFVYFQVFFFTFSPSLSSSMEKKLIKCQVIGFANEFKSFFNIVCEWQTHFKLKFINQMHSISQSKMLLHDWISSIGRKKNLQSNGISSSMLSIFPLNIIICVSKINFSLNQYWTRTSWYQNSATTNIFGQNTIGIFIPMAKKWKWGMEQVKGVNMFFSSFKLKLSSRKTLTTAIEH